jgi:hypothetical protein
VDAAALGLDVVSDGLEQALWGGGDGRGGVREARERAVCKQGCGAARRSPPRDLLPPRAPHHRKAPAAAARKDAPAGLPLSMRSTEASVLVAKNWKMVSMQRALMSLQSRKPSA